MTTKFIPQTVTRTDCTEVNLVSLALSNELALINSDLAAAGKLLRSSINAAATQLAAEREELEKQYQEAVTDLAWDTGLAVASYAGLRVAALLVAGGGAATLAVAGGVLLAVGVGTTVLAASIIRFDNSSPGGPDVLGLMIARQELFGVFADPASVASPAAKKLGKFVSFTGNALTAFQLFAGTASVAAKKTALSKLKAESDLLASEIAALSAQTDLQLGEARRQHVVAIMNMLGPSRIGCQILP